MASVATYVYFWLILAVLTLFGTFWSLERNATQRDVYVENEELTASNIRGHFGYFGLLWAT